MYIHVGTYIYIYIYAPIKYAHLHAHTYTCAYTHTRAYRLTHIRIHARPCNACTHMDVDRTAASRYVCARNSIISDYPTLWPKEKYAVKKDEIYDMTPDP